jgi:hypothetical protein
MSKLFNFSNFDNSAFDADAFNGPTGAGVSYSQVGIKATNTSSSTTENAQFFNFLRLISEISDASLTSSVPGIYPNILLSSGTPDAIVTNSRTFFNQAGSLLINESSTAGVLIEGTTVPYLTLVKGSALLNFKVGKLRYSYTSDSQLDQEIIIFQRTIFGAYKENRISPRSYFDPNQQQSKVVDIPISFGINAEVGINIALLPSEVVTLNLFVEQQTAPAI